MDAPLDIINWAKKSQYLSRVDIIKSSYLDGGKLDERHPELLRMERMSLEYLYAQNPTDPRLTLIGNYVLSLCGRYLRMAKSQTQVNMWEKTAYYTAMQTNELPSDNDILSWPFRSKIQADGDVLANYASYIGTPSYLFMAEPIGEPIKTNYFFSDDDKGSIGTNSAWASGVTVGAFRVYVTNYKTETDFAYIQFKD